MPGVLNICFPPAVVSAALRPHTVHAPSELFHIAGRALIDHVLKRFDTLPATLARRFVFILAPGSEALRLYLEQAYPGQKFAFIEQTAPEGPAQAIYHAGQQLSGPVLIAGTDRLFETDLSFLTHGYHTAITWTRTLADSGRGGFVSQNQDGWVSKISRKPAETGDRLAAVGMYYFPDSTRLLQAIEEQLADGLPADGIYRIEDAINRMLIQGVRFRTEPVSAWLDTESPEAILEMNAYLLENGRANFRTPMDTDAVRFIPPAFVDPTAGIDSSLIGPNVSIGPNCRVEGSALQNCIIGAGSRLLGCSLKDSIVGRNATIEGVSGIISIGDNASISTEPPGGSQN